MQAQVWLVLICCYQSVANQEALAPASAFQTAIKAQLPPQLVTQVHLMIGVLGLLVHL